MILLSGFNTEAITLILAFAFFLWLILAFICWVCLQQLLEKVFLPEATQEFKKTKKGIYNLLTFVVGGLLSFLILLFSMHQT